AAVRMAMRGTSSSRMRQDAAVSRMAASAKPPRSQGIVRTPSLMWTAKRAIVTPRRGKRSYEFQIHITRKSSQDLAESLQMLLQDLTQRLGMDVVIVLELQDESRALARVDELRLDAELLNLVQIELPLFAKESANQGLRLFGLQMRPCSRLLGRI